MTGVQTCALPILIIWRSTNARDWTNITLLDYADNDIRDPKFAIIAGQLFLYALINQGWIADPYLTIYTNSSDGLDWSQPFKPVNGTNFEIDGWLFWRPKSPDNITWYVPVYWWEHGKSALLNSSDGVNWTYISQINEGGGNDETAIEFYDNGTIICTARIEGVADAFLGDPNAGTLLSTSNFPYTSWNSKLTRLTRLDGPYLFKINDKIYAIARYQPERDALFTQLGSIFSTKRTSIYMVTPEKLTYISDLPSAGDTSYPGMVIRGGQIYTCYYTSNVQHDYPWFLGMFEPSDIKMANISVISLENAVTSPLIPVSELPWGGYLVIAADIGLGLLLIVFLVRKKRLKLLNPFWKKGKTP